MTRRHLRRLTADYLMDRVSLLHLVCLSEIGGSCDASSQAGGSFPSIATGENDAALCKDALP